MVISFNKIIIRMQEIPEMNWCSIEINYNWTRLNSEKNFKAILCAEGQLKTSNSEVVDQDEIQYPTQLSRLKM